MASGQGCFRKAFDAPLVLTEPTTTPRSFILAAKLRQTLRGWRGPRERLTLLQLKSSRVRGLSNNRIVAHGAPGRSGTILAAGLENSRPALPRQAILPNLSQLGICFSHSSPSFF